MAHTPQATAPSSPPPKPPVPISRDTALQLSTSTTLPPIFRYKDRLANVTNARESVTLFLETDLQTKRLEKMYPYLWLAGLPRAARPLHRQKVVGRNICVTENPEEHMTWHDTTIFIKPLPDYFFDHNLWEETICDNGALYRSACGLLLSYVWLISYRSDLRIAHEMGLLPSCIKWEIWTRMVLDFSSQNDVQTRSWVSPRYEYGELRLSRLNTLYRLGAAGFSATRFVYGYISGSKQYTTFFERNFGWLLVVFIYITVILSALQVALATERLGSDGKFQAFSYDIALISLGFVAAAIGIILAVWACLFWFYILSTLRYHKRPTVLRLKGGTKV
ncbi:hypothetical protein BDP55DRAFT_660484 [Colletotrichum godetiae]|uniref:Subtilisin-like serine protease n=1 Tax=Colletotrichum godetiae TaxID=1209918 RepID=A0AAJ0ANX6_9PEZI|nr:uncharacterized protein BDP55DRAFT_660484 [Colletotrichum godetiae]KAK1676694.1 hypothetical protein BDP55DRAFT_660484 [Colletotrichum godetiae]